MTEQKTITVPDSWEEVSIAKFQEINQIDDNNKNKALEIISILIDQDIEDIRKYSLSSLNAILEAINWANKLPSGKAFRQVIEIECIEYGFVNKLSDLTLGEWVDLESYLEDSINNLHKIAAIFYRPIIVEYSETQRLVEDYDTVTADVRAEIFKYKMNVGDMYGAMVFFCLIEKECIVTIQDYFLQEIIRMKLKSKVNQNEKLGWLKRLKLRSGLGTLTLMSWLKGTSQRLRASLN